MAARDKAVRTAEREAARGIGGPKGPAIERRERGGNSGVLGSASASERDISAKTGISRTEVQRAEHRATALGAEAVRAINRTALDKGSELDALVKLPSPHHAAMPAAV